MNAKREAIFVVTIHTGNLQRSLVLTNLAIKLWKVAYSKTTGLEEFCTGGHPIVQKPHLASFRKLEQMPERKWISLNQVMKIDLPMKDVNRVE